MSALHRIESCVVLAALLLLPACSVNVKKGQNGEDKKVDIETPVGGIHVNKDVDVRDTGLDVYPGARPKPRDEDRHNDESANVNISAGPFSLRVVVMQYESDDPPAKVISYYRTQLKRYGTVLECRTNQHVPQVKMDPSDKDDDEQLLSCDEHGGDNVELKVGTKQNQRIVAVREEGKGSSFALVRVQTRGKDTI